MASSVAASLPTDALCHIFSVASRHPYYVSDPPTTVLSFEERVRAESVNKHWRAVLSTHPGAFTSLHLSPHLRFSRFPWQQRSAEEAEEEEAAEAEALSRLGSLAARKPAVANLWLRVEPEPSRRLSDAYAAALEALLSCPGASSTLSFSLENSADPMLPILARAAPLQGFQGLYLQHSGFAGLQLQLQPAGALASLPHVRTLTVQASLATSVRLALPMPALSSITVLAAEEELGPISAKLVAIGRPGARGAQPAALFPALTSLDLEAGQVWLFCRAMPALASMRLHLFFPDAGLVLSEPAALAALSTLDLAASSVLTPAVIVEGGAEGADTSVHSNCFYRLLSAPLPALRSLSLDVCEPVSAGVERALAQLTGLTALSLHFYPEIDAQRVMEEFEARWGGAGDEEAEPVEGEGGGPGQPAARPAPPPMPALDCALLEGMAGLQELRTNDGSCLASPAAVARLPALRTLGLTTADELPALAPHLGGITRLELGSPCAAALAEDEAACQALPSLTALLCLDLKDRNYLYTKDAAAASAAREEHAHAVQALVALLPAGCEVRANAPGRP